MQSPALLSGVLGFSPGPLTQASNKLQSPFKPQTGVQLGRSPPALPLDQFTTFRVPWTSNHMHSKTLSTGLADPASPLQALSHRGATPRAMSPFGNGVCLHPVTTRCTPTARDRSVGGPTPRPGPHGALAGWGRGRPFVEGEMIFSPPGSPYVYMKRLFGRVRNPQVRVIIPDIPLDVAVCRGTTVTASVRSQVHIGRPPKGWIREKYIPLTYPWRPDGRHGTA
jgi:hypothetical protein